MISEHEVQSRLEQAAESVGRMLLASPSTRLVLAESCTGGMVAAMLTQIPGISQNFCGSCVVYRNSSKQDWLNISQGMLEQFSAESMLVTESMALNVLEHSPEANWSAAVTGHLGPNAPDLEDGMVFLAIARRVQTEPRLVVARQVTLVEQRRVPRQLEASAMLLELINETLTRQEPTLTCTVSAGPQTHS